MHHYAFHIGDYASHAGHLSPLEDIAYRRLLDAYFLREGPLFGTPADVARIVRLTGHEKEVESVLHEFFVPDNGGWRHDGAEAKIASYRKRLDDASRAGRASSNARSTVVQPPFNGRSTTVQPTRNQEPGTSTEARSARPSPSAPPCPDGVSEQTWADYRKTRKKAITATGLARIVSEAKKAGWTLEAVLVECCARGWQGFKAEWVAKRDPFMRPAEPMQNAPLPVKLRPTIIFHEPGNPNCGCDRCKSERRRAQ